MRRVSRLRSWEIYRVMRSINIPRLRRYGIREFASSIRTQGAPYATAIPAIRSFFDCVSILVIRFL